MKYISESDLVHIHDYIISRYGGRPGYKDQKQLGASLYTVRYYYSTLAQSAGALMYYINKDHIWNDGQKRTSAVATRIFLNMNNADLKVSENVFKTFLEEMADNKYTKEDSIEFICKHIVYRNPRYIYYLFFNDNFIIRNEKIDIKNIIEGIKAKGIKYALYKTEEQIWIKGYNSEDINWWKRFGYKIKRLRI